MCISVVHVVIIINIVGFCKTLIEYHTSLYDTVLHRPKLRSEPSLVPVSLRPALPEPDFETQNYIFALFHTSLTVSLPG